VYSLDKVIIFVGAITAVHDGGSAQYCTAAAAAAAATKISRSEL
jgi:hypothetical protein